MCPTGPWIQLSECVSERRKVLPFLPECAVQIRDDAERSPVEETATESEGWRSGGVVEEWRGGGGEDAAWLPPSNRVKSGSRVRRMHQWSFQRVQSGGRLRRGWMSPTVHPTLRLLLLALHHRHKLQKPTG